MSQQRSTISYCTIRFYGKRNCPPFSELRLQFKTIHLKFKFKPPLTLLELPSILGDITTIHLWISRYILLLLLPYSILWRQLELFSESYRRSGEPGVYSDRAGQGLQIFPLIMMLEILSRLKSTTYFAFNVNNMTRLARKMIIWHIMLQSLQKQGMTL